ncbi:TetR/AcrR family transcriptional regulator [soil metagenome]
MGRPQKRTNEARRGESQEKILDAAETVFATGGFNGVSLKDIANAAGVDTSLVHYYFATKAGMFAAVLARRADEVNAARLASMRAYEAKAGDAVTVEGALRAYLEPAFRFAYVECAAGRDKRDYLTLIAQINSTPAGAILGSDVTPFDPAVQVFIDLLRKASPSSPDADLYWFYHMLSGAISHTWARTGRIDQLSKGLCRSEDFETIAEQMIAIFANGLAKPRRD